MRIKLLAIASVLVLSAAGAAWGTGAFAPATAKRASCCGPDAPCCISPEKPAGYCCDPAFGCCANGPCCDDSSCCIPDTICCDGLKAAPRATTPATAPTEVVAKKSCCAGK